MSGLLKDEAMQFGVAGLVLTCSDAQNVQR